MASSVRPMQGTSSANLSVSQFADPTQDEFTATYPGISNQSGCVASHGELCWKFLGVTSLSLSHDSREEACCLFPQHEHFTLILWSVSLFVILHAWTRQFTVHSHGLTCVLRRRLDQTAFGFAFVQKHVSHTCLTSTSSTRVFHSGGGAGEEVATDLSTGTSLSILTSRA